MACHTQMIDSVLILIKKYLSCKKLKSTSILVAHRLAQCKLERNSYPSKFYKMIKLFMKSAFLLNISPRTSISWIYSHKICQWFSFLKEQNLVCHFGKPCQVVFILEQLEIFTQKCIEMLASLNLNKFPATVHFLKTAKFNKVNLTLKPYSIACPRSAVIKLVRL